jgi:hypothetical protein
MGGLSTVGQAASLAWDRRDAAQSAKECSIETTFLKYYLESISVITFR